MSVPDEYSIYCSRCSSYNLGSNRCICESCTDKMIDKVKEENQQDNEEERNVHWNNCVDFICDKLKKEFALEVQNDN